MLFPVGSHECCILIFFVEQSIVKFFVFVLVSYFYFIALLFSVLNERGTDGTSRVTEFYRIQTKICIQYLGCISFNNINKGIIFIIQYLGTYAIMEYYLEDMYNVYIHDI